MLHLDARHGKWKDSLESPLVKIGWDGVERPFVDEEEEEEEEEA